jgi:hypothetical protein
VESRPGSGGGDMWKIGNPGSVSVVTAQGSGRARKVSKSSAKERNQIVPGDRDPARDKVTTTAPNQQGRRRQ